MQYRCSPMLWQLQFQMSVLRKKDSSRWAGVKIKDHRLFWRSNAEPERLKMLQKAASERQQKKIELNPGKSERTAEGAEEGKEDGKKVQIEAVERG